MHKYLRAVGFSKIKNRKELQALIVKAVQKASEKSYTTVYDDSLYAEYHAEFGDRIGLCIRGEYDEENKFIYDYYFPYLRSDQITTMEDISVERQVEKISYAGIVDDLKMGLSLIFYLQNIITYMKLSNADRLPIRGTALTLTGLSDSGKILLPIIKDANDIRKEQNYNNRKSRMIAAAKKGDEDAIENLTLEDMDTYSTISKRILSEDVFSLVDTSLMPYGVECDLYSILGEIKYCDKVMNSITKEEIYIMTLNVNDILIDVCINKQDLLGEPELGRRFKGVIWLQGRIHYPEEA